MNGHELRHIVPTRRFMRPSTMSVCPGAVRTESLPEGQKKDFGELVILRPALNKDGSESVARVVCRCSCDREVIVDRTKLVSGQRTSCGCVGRKALGKILSREMRKSV